MTDQDTEDPDSAPPEAGEEDIGEEPLEELPPEEEMDLAPEEETLSPEDDALGEFRLVIHHIIPDKDSSFTAALTPEGGGDSISLTMTDQGALTTGTFAGIHEGKYTLKVTGTHYVPYSQSIEIASNCVTITLYNDDAVNEGREAGKLFGVIALGDFDGSDGKITDADAKLVRKAIDSKDTAYDMDGDGDVDLTDLAYVVRNQNGNTEAKPVRTMSVLALKKAAKAETSSGSAQVAGSGEGETPATVEEALLSSDTDSYVELAPENPEQPISDTNPVEIGLELAGADESSGFETAAITIAPPVNSQNTITEGTVEITTDDGSTYTAAVKDEHDRPGSPREFIRGIIRKISASSSTVNDVTVENDGTIVIDIGTKVAVKKVSIRVTGTSSGDLAEIASVQFLEDFADRIPEPDLSIPTIDEESITNTEDEDKALTFSWDAQTNVTGYEISISGPGLSVQRSVTQEEGTSYTFQSDSFNGRLKAFAAYELRVRSVNGSWRSEWCEPVSYIIKCTKKPPTPEYLNAAGGVLSITVTWRDLYDTQSWNLYYRQKGTEGAYTEVEGLTSPSYTLTGLTARTEYEFYVVGVNENGPSDASNTVSAVVLTAEGVKLPMYGLINRSGTLEGGDLALSNTHIASIEGNADKKYSIYRPDGSIVENGAATAEDWQAIVDNDPTTYAAIPDWDSGVSYHNFRGPKITLTESHKIGAVRIAPSEAPHADINAVQIGYRNAEGQIVKMGTQLSHKQDDQGRRFYEAVLYQPIDASYLEVYTSTVWASNGHPMTITEIGLYEYDSLSAEVDGLFTDWSQITLKPEVKEEDIEAIEAKVSETDPQTGEIHPRAAVLGQLLTYAKSLLNDHVANIPVFTVDTTVAASQDPKLDFAQALSDNQPLGYVAAAGDTVIVYVGSTSDFVGANANMKLVATQYHPEVSSWSRDVTQLKVGRNEIVIPKLSSDEKEKGGSLYIWYTGSAGAKDYTIRVLGAQKIPMLNVDGLDDAQRDAAIAAYLTELDSYTSQISTLHGEKHTGSTNADYAYNERECFLNSTEIVMENMVFSFPATQVQKGLEGEDRAARLKNAIAAMEQEIELFYQFKGLHRQGTGTDRWPSTRLNIRYHQMFTGAFMYAGGKHIGIEWGSVPGLFGTSPVVTDDKGQKLSGGYSGWGIAHEIGHCINAASYQRVEVTNNVFAQLAQTDETSKSFRTTYDKVYKAVAAGNTGHTGDLAVQLAMYWQLHLAYDNDYSYRFYAAPEEQQKNLFYARVDSYMRDSARADAVSKANGRESAKLVLNGTADQNFMRACVAAAQLDLLDFFRAWGFQPDGDTVAYASHFDREERDIQFIDDDSRLYRIQGGSGMSEGTAVTAHITNATSSRISNENQVVLSLANSCSSADAMLGYEIFRNGTLVAFVPAEGSSQTFTDIVSTENNKAFVYTVIGVDRLLGETAPAVLPEVKVCHDGAIDKAAWTAETNMRSEDDVTVAAGDQGYCEETFISAITKVFDSDPTTAYYGTVEVPEDENGEPNHPEIILNLGGVEQVTALKLNAGGASAITDYEISVSTDGAAWIPVKTGTFETTGEQTVYFNKVLEDGSMDPYMYIYPASFLKLTATSQTTVSLNELDILGPTNDNVDLREGGFGRLSDDFHYASGPEDFIPRDSIIFFGDYKGDPSYSVVVLKDQNGAIISGDQIILADVAKEGCLGQTSDGRWFYWLENEDALSGIESVQAELYRVQDAQKLTGQRLTSTSLHFTIPEKIPEVTITSASDHSGDTAAQGPEAFSPVSAADILKFAAGVPETAAAAGQEGRTVSSAVQYARADVPGAQAAPAVQVISSSVPGDKLSAIDQALTMTYDETHSQAVFSLYASEEPIAMHTAIAVEGLPDAEFQWTGADGATDLFLDAAISNGILDLYVVARTGHLGSDVENKENTKVISGTISLASLLETDAEVSFSASSMDYVGQDYRGYRHDEIDADLKCVFSAPVTPPVPAEPEGGGTPGETPEPPAPDAGDSPGHVPDCPHDDVTKTADTATCTHPGYIETYCNTCQQVIGRTETPARGHQYEGNICVLCGHERTPSSCTEDHHVGPLKDSGDAKEPTCTEYGQTANMVCSACGEIVEPAVSIDPMGHDYDENGVCTRCGHVLKGSCAGGKHEGPIVSSHDGHDPSCTFSGRTDSTVCLACGETVSESETIQALGHDYDENGVCTRCGHSRPADAAGTCKDGSHAGPIEKDIDGVTPSCTEPGWTDSEHCEACGQIVKDRQVLPALGHDYDENGVCMRCGETRGSSSSGSHSSGGGSSSSSSSSQNVTTSGSAEAGTTTTAKPKATVKDGTARADIGSAMSGEILEQAEKNSSGTVVVAPEISKDADRAEVGLPGSLLSGLAEKTQADLRVETPAADVTIPHGALAELGEAKNVTVSAERKDGGAVSVEIQADGKTVDSVSTGILVELDIAEGQVAALVDEEGNETILPKSILEDGKMHVLLPGSATVKVIDNAKAFGDVAADAWFASAVEFASSHELFNGVSDTAFDPAGSMTRSMLATVLWRLEQEKEAGTAPSFADIPADQWYTEAVAWASREGIVNGYGNGTFGPEDDITREQLAAMIHRYAESIGMDTAGSADLTRFPDSTQVSGWAAQAMGWAVEAGIFEGTGSGLNPGGTASRAEVAAVMERVVRLIVK